MSEDGSTSVYGIPPGKAFFQRHGALYRLISSSGGQELAEKLVAFGRKLRTPAGEAIAN